MYKRNVKGFRSVWGLLLTVCLLISGVPFEAMEAYADVTVYNIWANLQEEGEPSEFEVAEEQPTGKDLYAKYITGGDYTTKESDRGLTIWANNANIDASGVELGGFELSGNSSINFGNYTVSSVSEGEEGKVCFPACNVNVSVQGSGEELFSFYTSEPYLDDEKSDTWRQPYDYIVTGTWNFTGCLNTDKLTVNVGASLVISNGTSDEGTYASFIDTNHAVINGNVTISNSMVNEPNQLNIQGGGKLELRTGGSLIGEDNAILEIRENASVTGIDLYDYWNEESSKWIAYPCDGNQQECTNFFYDTDESKWVRVQGGGAPGTLPENKFRIIKIGDGEHSLTINNNPSEFDNENSDRAFITGTPITFNITGDVYKVIVVPSEPENVLTVNDGAYSYTPQSNSYFEILVYTSEDTYKRDKYDQCQPGTGEISVEYEVRHRDEGEVDENNTVTCEAENKNKISYGNLTKLILADTVTQVSLKIQPVEGYSYEIFMHGEDEQNTDVTDSAKDNNDIYVWDLTNPGMPEICFYRTGSNEPGEGEHGDVNSQDLKSYIESQQFAFGDWDGDNVVDENDIMLGMAYQIYYPKLSQNENLKNEYNIHSSESQTEIGSLKDLISVNADSSKNIIAKDLDGNDRTIPAYTYTVTLTKGTGETAETIVATGTAYAFAFTDDSKYQKNSRGCIIAVTEKGDQKNYFLRCANAYAYGTSPDTTPMFTGENVGEQAIVVVSDFDVIYNAQDSTYERKVSIFGNGASLDHLLSQEEDTDIVAYQGRNEMLINDINSNHGKNLESIFSIFTFCQKSFKGVQVSGSGASGNTPSWAFNQYKVLSTDDVKNTQKEAVVYFGNQDVTIRPVDRLGGLDTAVTGIESVTLADDNIPTEAVDITERSAQEWKLTFNSDFYDQVKLQIVYNLSDDSTRTSYLNIHRVGIDILDGNGSKDMTLFHGTENGPTYNATGERVIWATYYYPEAGDAAVDLYVTYTWPDRTITKRTIRNSSNLNLDYQHDNTNDCRSSDFVLYDGSEEGAPIKVEAIAVVSGFDNTTSTTFSGAKFGAGKGVVWNNYLGNN